MWLEHHAKSKRVSLLDCLAEFSVRQRHELVVLRGGVVDTVRIIKREDLGRVEPPLILRNDDCHPVGAGAGEVRERALRSSGIKKYYILRMPQRPGALRDFLNILGPHDDISRFEYLKKSARNFGSVLIGIEASDPENFSRIETKMASAGFAFRDITNDEVLAEFLI